MNEQNNDARLDAGAALEFDLNDDAANGDGRIPVSAREELMRKVDAYIESVSGSAFGDFGAFKRPFSANFKSSVRETFEDDEDVFARVDASERFSVWRGFRLRSITGATYAVKTALIWFLGITLIVGDADKMGRMAGDMLEMANAPTSGSGAFLFGVGVIIAAWVVRRLVRVLILGEIRTNVANMASFVIARLSRINDTVTNALDCAETDRKPRAGWATRAGEWVSIALWNEERAREIDRFVTASAWRVENSFRYIERGFQSFNLIALAGVAGHLVFTAVAHGGGGGLPLVGLIMIYVVSCLVWTFSSVAQRLQISEFQKNSFWGDIFGESFAQFGEEKRHVFRKIAERVARDKNTIIDLSPGGGGD